MMLTNNNIVYFMRILALRPYILVTSAPEGGWIIDPLIMIIPILTALPRIIPATTDKIFLITGFKFFLLL